jgi:hypothetical protein
MITYFYIRFDISDNKEKRFELEFFGDYYRRYGESET